MIELPPGISTECPDATFDIDGTILKLNGLEAYVYELCEQSVFEPLPSEIVESKRIWKENNNEQNYVYYTNLLVNFFIEQIKGKSISRMTETADTVADSHAFRSWNIITKIMQELRKTHNIIAVSHMPEQLMEPLTRNLGCVALIGSYYEVENDTFTGKARGINKADEYAKLRNGETGHLDYHFGDTVGDLPLLEQAKHGVMINPSFTLTSHEKASNWTMITTHKDMVTVLNPTESPSRRTASIWGPPFDVPAILREIKDRQPTEEIPRLNLTDFRRHEQQNRYRNGLSRRAWNIVVQAHAQGRITLDFLYDPSKEDGSKRSQLQVQGDPRERFSGLNLASLADALNVLDDSSPAYYSRDIDRLFGRNAGIKTIEFLKGLVNEYDKGNVVEK